MTQERFVVLEDLALGNVWPSKPAPHLLRRESIGRTVERLGRMSDGELEALADEREVRWFSGYLARVAALEIQRRQRLDEPEREGAT